MLYAQLTHSIALNDVCDSLKIYSSPLSAIRGATPPARNTLSHAGKNRPALLAEKLFWQMLGYLQSLAPDFCRPQFKPGFTRQFKRTIHLVDSTVDGCDFRFPFLSNIGYPMRLHMENNKWHKNCRHVKPSRIGFDVMLF